MPPSPLKYFVSVRLQLKKLDKIREDTRGVKRYMHYLRDVGRALSQDLGGVFGSLSTQEVESSEYFGVVWGVRPKGKIRDHRETSKLPWGGREA